MVSSSTAERRPALQGDALEIAGPAFEEIEIVQLPDRPEGHAGIVWLDADGRGGEPATRVEFRDLEPVDQTGTTSLSFSPPLDDADNQTILEAASAGRSTLRSGDGSFEALTFDNPTNSLTINLGDDPTESLSVQPHTIAVPIDVNGGTGANPLSLANGVSLVGGEADLGAGTDTLDYSAYATPVTANLGSSAPLAATMEPQQEVPATSSTASGTGTLTYDVAAKTFDVNVTVSGMTPATVTGFHIHAAPTGVNGPIIVDFTSGSLVPAGDGFTFTGNDIALPAAQEAALLGGQTYLNVHTAAFPNGAIRGQLIPSALFAAAPGTGTGTGGISNVENVTGGSAGDSLVGNLVLNVMAGGGGADTLVASRGNDTAGGGAADDILVWSNGDGTDILDGEGDADRVVVNGSVDPAIGDIFTATADAPRLDFNRSTPGPFSLDIGSTETLSVIGNQGDDSLTLDALAGIADLSAVHLHGFSGDDTLVAVPSTAVSLNIVGGPQAASDHLSFDPACLAVTTGAGSLTAAGAQPLTHTGVEDVAVASAFRVAAPTVNVSEGAGNQVVLVNRTGTGTATADFQATAGSALAGTDFTPAAGTLSMGPGVTTAALPLSLVNDAIVESDETFGVSLTSPGAFAQVCAPSTTEVTVTDDDSLAPLIPFSIDEVKASKTNGSAKLTLVVPSPGTVTAVAKAKKGRVNQKAKVVVAKGKLEVDAASEPTLKLRPNDAGKDALEKLGRLKVAITATFVPTVGDASVATASAKLKLADD